MAIVSWKVNFLLLYLSVLYRIIRKGASLPSSSEIGGFLITNWIRKGKKKLKILCGFVHLLLKEPQIIMKGEWEAAGRKRVWGEWQRYLFKLLLDLIMAGWLKRRGWKRGKGETAAAVETKNFPSQWSQTKDCNCKMRSGRGNYEKIYIGTDKKLKANDKLSQRKQEKRAWCAWLDCEILIGI